MSQETAALVERVISTMATEVGVSPSRMSSEMTISDAVVLCQHAMRDGGGMGEVRRTLAMSA